MTTDTNTLIETVREALLAANEDVYGPLGNQDSLAALSSLAAQSAEWEARWERLPKNILGAEERMVVQRMRADQAEARLDRALSALRNIQQAAEHRQQDGVNDQGWISASWTEDRCRCVIAEIEGEA